MRQVGDLLVWFALIVVLALVAYFTPKLAQHMSSDVRRSQSSWYYRDLAWNQPSALEPSE
jgi:hypothetical protein